MPVTFLSRIVWFHTDDVRVTTLIWVSSASFLGETYFSELYLEAVFSRSSVLKKTWKTF